MLNTFSWPTEYPTLHEDLRSLTFEQVLNREIPPESFYQEPSDCFDRISCIKTVLSAMFHALSPEQQDTVVKELGWERDKI